jgi:TRAF3-interacting protein 1
VRELIQTVCRSANPLGKMFDYVQEDYENMQRELDRWRQECANQMQQLEEEQRATEQALGPYTQKLMELDAQVREVLTNIKKAKAQVVKNDETINKMLRMVLHH